MDQLTGGWGGEGGGGGGRGGGVRGGEGGGEGQKGSEGEPQSRGVRTESRASGHSSKWLQMYKLPLSPSEEECNYQSH